MTKETGVKLSVIAIVISGLSVVAWWADAPNRRIDCMMERVNTKITVTEGNVSHF